MVFVDAMGRSCVVVNLVVSREDGGGFFSVGNCVRYCVVVGFVDSRLEDST